VDLAPYCNVADAIVAEGSKFSLAPHMAWAYGTYVAGQFRQSVTNAATWDTLAGLTLAVGGQKDRADRLLRDRPEPTATERRQAEALLRLQNPASVLFQASSPSPSLGNLLSSSQFLRIVSNIFYCGLLLTCGLPAILAALLFRGGLVLRLLGLAVVKRNGSRASRLRVFWRSLLTWAPFGALVWLSFLGFSASGWRGWVAPIADAVISVALAGCYLGLKGRSLQDRLAGTTLVPR
jgi:hypothetical protein